MNEQELRAIVRAAIARHAGVPEPMNPPRPSPASSVTVPAEWRAHASHGLYASVVNPSDACVIEPAVPCNHCNYCRSHGH